MVDDRTRNWLQRHEKVTDAETLSALESIVRRYPDGPYTQLTVSGAFFNGRRTYIITVDGMGSSYCTNVRRDHTGNKIYFEVTPDGVRQRCFCQKSRATGCLLDACPKYHSRCKALSGQNRRLLFPESKP